MTSPTVLIADDEAVPRARLAQALQSVWPEARIVATCVNGADAWDAFLEHEPAVCFLDIRMPGLSGVDVARRIAGRAEVVFVTAHNDHALAAFDAGAIDYVLKPLEDERLARAVARVQDRLGRRLPPDSSALHTLLTQLQGQIRRPPPLQFLQAAVGREVLLIRVADVVFFESDARYTRVVHGGDGQRESGEALIRMPLKELLTQLDPELFWQVHRSVLVNHHHIASAVRVDEGHMHLTLRGRAEKLPVSRHFQGLFRGQ